MLPLGQHSSKKMLEKVRFHFSHLKGQIILCHTNWIIFFQFLDFREINKLNANSGTVSYKEIGDVFL